VSDAQVDEAKATMEADQAALALAVVTAAALGAAGVARWIAGRRAGAGGGGGGGEGGENSAKLLRDGIRQRVSRRLGGQPLPYTDAEIDSFVNEGKALGLSEQAIDDTLFRAMQKEKPQTAADVIKRLNERAEGEQKAKLAKAEAEQRRAAKEFQEDWARFDSARDADFKAKLREFRGNDDLTMNRNMSGGEGQLFQSPKFTHRVLKRWFKNAPHTAENSVKRLAQAQAVVDSNPNLKKAMSVVRVHENGSDWIIRDYDPTSIPIRQALEDPNVAGARQQAVGALKGKTDPVSLDLLKKIENNSGNLHWSPDQGTLLLIDTQ
jgi:hypothetical protein